MARNVVALAASRRSAVAARAARAPPPAATYDVGAATRDITPTGVVNLGGFGLGTGALVPDAIVGRGGQGEAADERIARPRDRLRRRRRARSRSPTSRRRGCSRPTRTARTAWTTSRRRSSGGRRASCRRDHVLIASDHSHSGPDTIGAWGGVRDEYLQHIHDQTVAAIVAAFKSRRDGERARGPLGRLRPDLQPVLQRGAEPGQGAHLPGARGVRDARQGRDGARRPGDATPSAAP